MATNQSFGQSHDIEVVRLICKDLTLADFRSSFPHRRPESRGTRHQEMAKGPASGRGVAGTSFGMSTRTDDGSERSSTDLRALWVEAAWGIGLIGGVLAFVAVLAATFGR
jgi:hypothetical protein